MSCMCGDTSCPSCGPAQGHDPIMDALFERMNERWPDVMYRACDWSCLEEAIEYAFE